MFGCYPSIKKGPCCNREKTILKMPQLYYRRSSRGRGGYGNCGRPLPGRSDVELVHVAFKTLQWLKNRLTPKPFRNLALPYSDLDYTKSPFPLLFRQLRYFVHLYNFKQIMFFQEEKVLKSCIRRFANFHLEKSPLNWKKSFCYVKQSFFTHDWFQN